MNHNRTMIILLFIPIVLSCSSGIDKHIDALSKREIQSTMEFLSLDHLEGRAPGTRGGELAEHYLKSVFKLLDIAPYEGSYFQEFTLKGFTLEALTLMANRYRLGFRKDVVGSYTRESEIFSLTGDAVFAGFGIRSEDWSWDDYKDVSVKDKILLVRVNEPDPSDPELFEGPALTYYGRWTYKIEEAARRGARAILLIHTTESAGYGWHVVENSWGGEEIYLPSAIENNLEFRGWIREEKLRAVLEAGGLALSELYARSEQRDFRPVDLGFQIRIQGRNRFRSFETRNVVGFIPGNDPKLSEKSILLSAHIDHLGMNPSLEGDSIFNGAIDNGSAVAAMIMSAKILKAYEKSLKYSTIILGCEAEESGLLGSLYFANSIDPEHIVANINFESTPVWEKSRDFMAVGARYSTLEDILKKILREEGLTYSTFSLKNQGFFYRSDQFSFARKGIPSIWISAGEDYVSGRNRLKDFFVGGDYHTVDDEYNPGWELESTIQTIRTTCLLVDHLNRLKPEIRWKGRMTFPVDE